MISTSINLKKKKKLQNQEETLHLGVISFLFFGYNLDHRKHWKGGKGEKLQVKWRSNKKFVLAHTRTNEYKDLDFGIILMLIKLAKLNLVY